MPWSATGVVQENINQLQAQPAALLVEEADTNLVQESTTALTACLVSTKQETASLSVIHAALANTKQWQLKYRATSAQQGRIAGHSHPRVMHVLLAQ
jgi:hypothetical protein